jgi:hypothetical protein
MLKAAFQFQPGRREHLASSVDMGASDPIRNQQSRNRVLKLYPSVPPSKARTE